MNCGASAGGAEQSKRAKRFSAESSKKKAMLIAVLDLEREPLAIDLTIPTGTIDFGDGIRQIEGLAVHGAASLLTEQRAPRQQILDIRLQAELQGRFEVDCARCLEPVEHPVEEQLDLLFRPLGVDASGAERAISTPETEIGYYQDGGLVLEDVLREQVLLSLPARALCRQDCKGLCSGCGRNLNTETCACDMVPPDPRWTALSDLRGRMKS